jgi:hypothetical protein
MTHRMGPKGQSAERVTAAARRARAATLLTGDPEILASGACRVEDLP